VTREHKLALIVGFSILLLVGVLISDHLSRARETQIDTVLEPAVAVEPADRSIPVDPLGPVNRTALTEAPGTTPGSGRPDVIDPQPQSPAASEPHTQIAEVPSGMRADPGPVLGGEGDIGSQLVKAGGTIKTGRDGIRELTLPNSTATPSMSTTPDRMHVVKKNDTLYALAKQYYGDAGLWPMLAAYNKDRVGKNGSLREGQSLRIPTRAVLTGKPDPAPAQKPLPSAKTVANETRIASSRTYTVKKNDTLGDVSMAVYGTSKRWRDILAANRGVIDNADRLAVGMVLKVPG
jgi:nucleoid-associated protein YgaU